MPINSTYIEQMFSDSSVINSIQTSIQNDDKRILFVSYYTLNTPYEEEAQLLIASLKKFGLSYYVSGVESMKDWYLNTLIKVYFIKYLRTRFPEYEAIVWLDADSELLSKPELLFNLSQIDFAVHGRGKKRSLWNLLQALIKCYSQKNRLFFKDLLANNSPFYKCFNCVMYFKNSAIVGKLLEDWIYEIEHPQKEHEQDQRTLRRCLINQRFYKRQLKLFNLPAEYAQKFSKLGPKTVIKQNQASRRLKDSI